MKLTHFFTLFFATACLCEQPLTAKEPITEHETDPMMLDLDPYLIDALYGSDKAGQTGRHGAEGGMAELLEEPAFVELVEKHNLQLFNGPALGDIQPDSVRVWVRTAGPAEVKVAIVDGPESAAAQTSAERDFTAVLTIEDLEPFTEYRYAVHVGEQVIQRDTFVFRTAPARGQRVAYHIDFGSGSRYVPINEHAWQTMARARPMAYLGLGDNVYIDVQHRRGAQRLFYYRRYLSPAWAELAASVGLYAVWDDHDMAMNDSQGGAGLDAAWKRPNWQVFRENWNNPAYGGGESMPGTWHQFTLGDVDFFMTDGRFYRDKADQTMLGPDQKAWLLDALRSSKAKVKVLASGTMWADEADKGGKDSWSGPWSIAERDEIFSTIRDEKIGGVVLISGDRHRSDIWQMNYDVGYPLYEFVSAKVTNMHTHKTRDQAIWSYNEGNFWGQLHFDFQPDDPIITFRCIDIGGESVKDFPIKLSQLQPQE